MKQVDALMWKREAKGSRKDKHFGDEYRNGLLDLCVAVLMAVVVVVVVEQRIEKREAEKREITIGSRSHTLADPHVKKKKKEKEKRVRKRQKGKVE